MSENGIRLIAEERHRQVEIEGWTAEHDRQHTQGELAIVGALYALDAVGGLCPREHMAMWPVTWHRDWWKPTPGEKVRQLVKAGALIAAEIDRLYRIEEKTWPGA